MAALEPSRNTRTCLEQSSNRATETKITFKEVKNNKQRKIKTNNPQKGENDKEITITNKK